MHGRYFDVMCFLEEKGISAEKYCDDMGSDLDEFDVEIKMAKD